MLFVLEGSYYYKGNVIVKASCFNLKSLSTSGAAIYVYLWASALKSDWSSRGASEIHISAWRGSASRESAMSYMIYFGICFC